MLDGLEFVTYEKNLCFPEYLIFYSRVYEAPFSLNAENELTDLFTKWPVVKREGPPVPVSPVDHATFQRNTRFLVLTRSSGMECARLHYYTDSSRSVYKGEFLILPGTSVLIHPERKHMLQISRPDGKRFIAILKCQNNRDERFKLWVATLTSECMAHPTNQATPAAAALATPSMPSSGDPGRRYTTTKTAEMVSDDNLTCLYDIPRIRNPHIVTRLANGTEVFVISNNVPSTDGSGAFFVHVRNRRRPSTPADGRSWDTGFVLLRNLKNWRLRTSPINED